MPDGEQNWDELQARVAGMEQRLRSVRRMIAILVAVVVLLVLAILFPDLQTVLGMLLGVPLVLLLILVPVLLYMYSVVWACERISAVRGTTNNDPAET
jgi:uncharacterized membrane protein